jgi:hypothetical protein
MYRQTVPHQLYLLLGNHTLIVPWPDVERILDGKKYLEAILDDDEVDDKIRTAARLAGAPDCFVGERPDPRVQGFWHEEGWCISYKSPQQLDLELARTLPFAR